MFAYCANNPIVRTDEGGNAWHVLISAAISGSISLTLSAIIEFSDGIDGKDFLKILVSTTCGSAEGALIALKPNLAVPTSAGLSATESVVNNLIDNAFAENDSDKRSTREIVVDAVTAGGVGALSAVVGGSNAAKGKEVINSGLNALGRQNGVGLHPITKKVTTEAVRLANKYIKNEVITSVIEDAFYSGYSWYASRYANEWIKRAYGG